MWHFKAYSSAGSCGEGALSLFFGCSTSSSALTRVLLLLLLFVALLLLTPSQIPAVMPRKAAEVGDIQVGVLCHK